MKLINRILFRISPALLVIMTLWAIFFYSAIITEINDEVDDSLESFSEQVIIRTLAGENIPEVTNGTNNQYYITEVSEAYATQHMHRRYIDSLVYIKVKRETEPARVLKTFFKDNSGRQLQLLVATPTIEKADLQEAILGWIMFLYLSLLIIIIVINLWMFRQNLRPLYVLLRWLDKYKVGTQNEPLHNKTDIIEFRKLNEAAIRNASRAENLFQQQNQFISNTSHEIQTPIAVCKNRLEMLMEDETLTEQQLEQIAKAHETLNNISRLNKSLLLLCKIDNGQFSDLETIRVNNLVKRYLSDFEEAYGYLNIQVSVQNKGTLFWSMNESLAGVLIANLLKNSFIHNLKNGSIEIIIRFDSLLICNTGTQGALDEHRIFDRFYHTQGKEGSTGLGLAIVDSICKLYQIRCDYSYENGKHCFEIKH